jgi:hypothetical protein
VKQESGRFLKKAAQKLLRHLAGGSETSAAQMNKVAFLLFLPAPRTYCAVPPPSLMRAAKV